MLDSINELSAFISQILILGHRPEPEDPVMKKIESPDGKVEFSIDERIYVKLTPDDVRRFQILLSGDLEIQKQLLHAEGQYAFAAEWEENSHGEKHLGEGRTLFLKLENPIVIGRKTIQYLRLKGVRPKPGVKMQAPVYYGFGYVERDLRVTR